MEKLTIYVKLLGEGVDVWRPVLAVKIDSSNVYLILPEAKNVVPDGEEWEFLPGDKVIVELKDLSEGPVLVAVKSWTSK